MRICLGILLFVWIKDILVNVNYMSLGLKSYDDGEQFLY